MTKKSSLHRQQQRLLGAAAALLGCSQTALLVCLPALADVTGLDSSQWALLIALSGALFLVGNPLWGSLSDRWGRRPVMIWGLGGFALSQAVAALALWTGGAALFWVLLASRFLYGISASAIYPVAQSWLCDSPLQYHEASVAPRLSRLSAAVNVGRLLGPSLTLLLIWFSPAAVLLALAVLALPLPFLFWRAQPQVPRLREQSATASQWPLLLLATALLLASVMGALQYSLGFLLRDFSDDGNTASLAAAAVLMGTSLVVVLLQWQCFNRLTTPWQWAVPLACLAICSGTLLPLLAPGLVSLLMSCVLIAAGVACVVPVYLAAAGLQGRQPGRLAGWFGAAHTAGQSSGAWLAGYLLLLGNTPLFIVLTLLSAGASGLLLFHRFSVTDPSAGPNALISIRKYYER